MTLHYVAVGVDGSLVAVRALDRAADEAVRRGAVLRIVYAVPDRDEAGPVLASAVARVRERQPGLPVVASATESGAVDALARESEGAALTVVGTRGLSGLTGLLLGSVSRRLAAQAHGPLLVVRGDHPCGDGGEVLLGLGDDTDADAAAYAFEEAERRGARLRVLHITLEPPSPVPRFTMDRLRERHPEVGVETRTVRTDPAQALLEATREVDVVVIGAHRGTSRLTHTLVHHSHCPVIVVPAG